MNIDFEKEIIELLNKDEEIRFGTIKRKIETIQSDPSFLNAPVKVWEEVLREFQRTTGEILAESPTKNDITPKLKRMAENYSRLLDSYREIKETIVPPKLEKIALDVQKGIADTLKEVHPILASAIPGRLPNTQPELLVKISASGLQLQRTRIERLKRRIRQLELGQYRSESANKVGLLGKLERILLNQRTQMWLWGFAVLVLIIFQFTDSDLEAEIFLFRDWAKLFVLLTTLWFPLLFIAPQTKNAHNYAIYSVIWATLFSIWAYGFLPGLLISGILLIVPIRNLLSHTDLRAPHRFHRHLVRPVALSLLVVGVVITHEFIWLIGLTIWLTYLVFLTSTSYRFFRQNYDLIEELYPDPKSHKQRSLFFVGALILSSLLLTTGIVGQVETDFVIEIYSIIAGFALTLVTILLAVQAIIPGITVWSKENAVARRIREMRFMIRANKGLGGFMSSFFYLFILAAIGWLVTQRFAIGYPIAVDLTRQHNFIQIRSVVDIISPVDSGFTYSPETTLLSVSTLLFVVCISLAIYSVFQLYYLFSTAGIFLLPIQDALLSNPAHIENVNVKLVKQMDKKDQIATFVRELIGSDRKLNGYVISEINVITDVNDDSSDNISIMVIIEMDFVELDEMIRLAYDTYHIFFESNKAKKTPIPIRHVGFAVFRDTYSRGRHNVFSLQIDRDEWQFLKKDVPEFTLEYKIKNVLRAKIVEYLLPDAQIF